MAKSKRKTTADKAKRAQEADGPSEGIDSMGDAAKSLAPGGAPLRPIEYHAKAPYISPGAVQPPISGDGLTRGPLAGASSSRRAAVLMGWVRGLYCIQAR